ncbi:hypothetical protein M419DRAFT_11274 [Trichoderma reesei RUT C-30]|uniref:Uncharacterized protein n=1 Tax=Hypocrea jecorina (strain ATCC 56765 / BCRC 32924 / NRRL 11460 / Rut C-30) TaxID=1344414 RepID=A0A024S245_HYPJR|nr:hypothetical protein M419DRAFT_11274 [Trichoderma reesei RUT C-30]
MPAGSPLSMPSKNLPDTLYHHQAWESPENMYYMDTIRSALDSMLPCVHVTMSPGQHVSTIEAVQEPS